MGALSSRAAMPTKSAAPGPDTDEQTALTDAVRALLAPVARLALARGLPFAIVQELFKQMLVQAADEAHPDLLPHRKVSRISTATGINRREVTRLIQVLREGRAGETPPRRSLASEVFAHWLTAAAYRDKRGAPKVLRRQGKAPSFESLARAVTRDVHPRSILDELVRLNLATHDTRADTVALKREAFVPHGDAVRMLQFLADNAGDHAAAAVENVLGDGQQHFEQAIFAEGLSAESLQAMRPHISALWQQLLEALVPMLEAKVEYDRERQGATQRLRVGFYTYQTDTEVAAPAPAPAGKKP
jgi:hypothetical protein